MESSRTAFIINIIAALALSQILYSQPLPPPGDSVKADLTAKIDSAKIAPPDSNLYGVQDPSFIGPIDPSLIQPLVELPPPPEFKPYVMTNYSAQSLGDILSHHSGFYIMQHGCIGQPEMITSASMLPGLQANYNGIPVFHQGSYFPFRSGPDMNVLMADNLSEINITSLSYLDLFTQGEMLSLESSAWPPIDNPSSVTVADGPYEFKKSAWRFSRRLTENMGAVFALSFKSTDGTYTSGADYEDFKVTGSFVWRPKTNYELYYSFYQYKAKEGIVQFDRIILPTLHSNNDLDHNMLKARYKYSSDLTFSIALFREHIYNHLFDDDISFNQIVKNDILGGELSAELVKENHLFKLALGGKEHKLRGVDGKPVIRFGALTLSDSLTIADSQYLLASGRLSRNRFDGFQASGTIEYNQPMGESSSLELSSGTSNYEPDIYALYYTHPTIVPVDTDYLLSYDYLNNDDLKSKRILFVSANYKKPLGSWLNANAGVSFEKVDNDLVSVVSEEDSAWTSTQENISYKRLRFTGDLNYVITKYFSGASGLTFFHYNPGEMLPGIKYSPSFIAYTNGEIKVEQVLKDIDLSGAFQVRYYSKRYYSGMYSVLMGQTEYDPAVVADGSLAIRFGSFEFRVIENNIFDFLGGNDYELWGNYAMPPGIVWWQFTWLFKN